MIIDQSDLQYDKLYQLEAGARPAIPEWKRLVVFD